MVATLSYLSIVVGELVPKSLALRSGERYALLVARPLQVLAWLVSGSVSVREINRELGLELPEEGEWTTIAGLCTAIAGRIPIAGDALELPGAVAIEIVDASPRRVRTLRIRSPVSTRSGLGARDR